RLRRELYVTLTCPNCGNDRNFLVKTLQMHVVNVEGGRVEVSEESRPAVLEVLCDECESALNFEEFEDTLRKEVLLTIGARGGALAAARGRLSPIFFVFLEVIALRTDP